MAPLSEWRVMPASTWLITRPRATVLAPSPAPQQPRCRAEPGDVRSPFPILPLKIPDRKVSPWRWWGCPRPWVSVPASWPSLTSPPPTCLGDPWVEKPRKPEVEAQLESSRRSAQPADTLGGIPCRGPRVLCGGASSVGHQMEGAVGPGQVLPLQPEGMRPSLGPWLCVAHWPATLDVP